MAWLICYSSFPLKQKKWGGGGGTFDHFCFPVEGMVWVCFLRLWNIWMFVFFRLWFQEVLDLWYSFRNCPSWETVRSVPVLVRRACVLFDGSYFWYMYTHVLVAHSQFFWNWMLFSDLPTSMLLPCIFSCWWKIKKLLRRKYFQSKERLKNFTKTPNALETDKVFQVSHEGCPKTCRFLKCTWFWA